MLTPTAGQIASANEALKRWRPNAKGAGRSRTKSGEMTALKHIKLARKLLDRAASIGGKP
ncbi:hypothetical protein [Bradyrhizobium sp. AUGA SZCCT0042]|uniref:hypothetical protein n=1 Tax=Bradyrhizobium sp. AUGA SZCCT0042 TaxID=2807651 RepID=UPI001BAD45C8|nr:hypothetical protein [Bradyrhizobium sp. AUGA SZCCT0042]MBR1296056.1 hypothetical protein [Bradyrhizobium sp. AUGA SZCCT0042]